MYFSLIICTFKRPAALLKLLQSVETQELYPNEILVIDGSSDDRTKLILEKNSFSELKYFKVAEEDRGLTRQRNYAIAKVAQECEIICFLDDDTVLEQDYFRNLIQTYADHPDAIGVGGYISNEVSWNQDLREPGLEEFKMDGYLRKLGSRNFLRKKLGLLSDQPPGVMPEFSNGLSIGFLPPSGKNYPVEFFMGGVSSYKKELFKKISFSSYFEGYGLYEDMDFCLRASRLGQLYVNTTAQLCHHHEAEGRPNKFRYGEMVLRNGWYVWRLKFPNPSLKSIIKWHMTALVLTIVRFGNSITSKDKKAGLTEALGRIWGWWSLVFHQPKLQ